ncbi:MAG: GNAT family N-acetyltransferase [Treponema sp.]|jgi:ribosomal protein S18 acetylase RimI-like enzyme|nr:GNAT family N-acetyltransferase [Treponema sp.]
MKEIIVRQAVLSDIPYFYEICLKTGDNGSDASALFSDPYLIGHYYAAPYVLYQKGICFAAEYENRPQGYVIAVPDTESYKQWLEESWLPPLRKQFPKDYKESFTDKEKNIINLIHKEQYPMDKTAQHWLSEYPAHLHIDLLPSIQGKGAGRKLINSLLNELKRQNISGLHLNVDISNKGAVCFYEKMGFSVIKEQEWGYTMGVLICG